jgi:hypothetical protein
LLSDQEREFLRTHDFGTSFKWDHLNALQELAEGWKGAEYEFDDEKIQGSFGVLIEKVSEFTYSLAIESNPLGNSKFFSVVPKRERISDCFSEKTLELVKKFNGDAYDLYDKINEFTKCARRQL